jgi:site-specific DNA-cytosine methylase
MPRKPSDFTIKDQFAGCGGSTSGAKKVDGARVILALNHWKLAIETHNTNHPETAHDCTDVSACDPRRYPSTNMLISSPECTNHSLAKGKRRGGLGQGDLFVPRAPNAAEERSRATMWDVPRFAEFHRYEYISVENVPDAAMWEMWEAWLFAMRSLGYAYRVLSLNSMFFWPCPQSRDRLYVVFWNKNNPAPDLDFRPLARCARCERDIHAVQSWKLNPRTKTPHWVGRYRRQYVYACPACSLVVEPYFFCALNALDLSLPAERIGDRRRKLQPRTMDRIRFGLEKFGNQYLVLTTNMTTDAGRVRSAGLDAGFTQTGSGLTALVSPAFIETAFSGDGARRASSAAAALPSQTARQSMAVVSEVRVHGGGGFMYDTFAAPVLTDAGFGSRGDQAASGALDALRTQTTAQTHGVTFPSPLLVNTRQGNGHSGRVRGAGGALGTQTADYDTAALIPSSMLVTAGSRETAPSPANEAAPTFTGSERLGVLSSPAFLTTLRSGNTGSALAEASDSFCANAHHGLVIHGSALLTMRDSYGVGFLLRSLEAPLGTQVATCTQDWLVSRGQFLASYYGTHNVAGVGEAVATITTLDRQALVGAAEDVPLNPEDCHFRMLQPHEIQARMAFDREYVVLGTKREKVKQLGNAVTPPVMEWIVGRCVNALDSGDSRKGRAAE